MVKLYRLRFEVVKLHTAQLHAMKKAASLCRGPYPLCQVEMLGNLPQHVLRKAEQVHPLHNRNFLQPCPAPACSLPWYLFLMRCI